MSIFDEFGTWKRGFVVTWRLAVFLMLLVWNGSPVAAQLKIGGNFPISGGSGFESAPAVAVNPGNGSFLVVWTSTDPSASSPSNSVNRVLARRVSARGALLSEPIVVSQRAFSNPALGGSNPDVAYNSVDDEFLVVYERSYAGSSENGIYAQRVGPDGILRGNEIGLLPAPGQVRPVVAHDSIANRYLVMWTGGNDNAVFGGVFRNDGILLGTVNAFVPAGHTTRNPAIAFNAKAEQYLLAYEDTFLSASGSVTNVSGVILDANGATVGFERFEIPVGAGARPSPQVLFNSDQFLVTWGDNAGNVKSQRVDANGILSGSSVQLLSNAAFPRIAYSGPLQRYYLNWVLRNEASAKNGYVLGNFLKRNLTKKGDNFKVSDTASVEGKPAVAIGQNNSVGLSVWPRRGDDLVPKIWGQLVDISTDVTTLTLKVAASPKPVRTGEPLTYRIRVKNTGTAIGRNVQLTDTLPNGAELISASPSAGSCSHADAVVKCAFGDLPANSTLEVVLVVRPSRLGENTNKAVLDWSNNADDAAKTKSTRTKVVYPGTLSLLAPNGGENLPSGSLFDIVWDLQGGIAGDVLSYKLQYSLDKGKIWKPIAKGLPGNRYVWRVPAPAGNRPKVLVRVSGTNVDKVDRSDAPFAIEVLHLNAPVAGDVVNSGHTLEVSWTTHATRAPVARAVLSYSLNGGKKWNRLAAVEGNPGAYLWTIPDVGKPSPKSQVKVVLKSQKGKTQGSVISGRFTIMP